MLDTSSYKTNADSPTANPLHGKELTLEHHGRKLLRTLVQKPAAMTSILRFLVFLETRTQFLTLMVRPSKPAAQAAVHRTPQQRPDPEDRTSSHAHDVRTKLLGQARTGYRIGHASTCKSACATLGQASHQLFRRNSGNYIYDGGTHLSQRCDIFYKQQVSMKQD